MTLRELPDRELAELEDALLARAADSGAPQLIAAAAAIWRERLRRQANPVERVNSMPGRRRSRLVELSLKFASHFRPRSIAASRETAVSSVYETRGVMVL